MKVIASVKLEKERRFLVKLPQSWSDLAEMLEDIVDVKRIVQRYLTPEKGEPAVRIRKTVQGLGGHTETVYHFNQKEPTGDTGVHEETEREITEKQYHQYLKHSDPGKCAIEKTRFVFKWHDQVFELDLFKGHLKGLAILEIELEDMSDKIELPSFLRVIKEVTKDRRFSNFALSDKKSRR